MITDSHALHLAREELDRAAEALALALVHAMDADRLLGEAEERHATAALRVAAMERRAEATP